MISAYGYLFHDRYSSWYLNNIIWKRWSTIVFNGNVFQDATILILISPLRQLPSKMALKMDPPLYPVLFDLEKLLCYGPIQLQNTQMRVMLFLIDFGTYLMLCELVGHVSPVLLLFIGGIIRIVLLDWLSSQPSEDSFVPTYFAFFERQDRCVLVFIVAHALLVFPSPLKDLGTSAWSYICIMLLMCFQSGSDALIWFQIHFPQFAPMILCIIVLHRRIQFRLPHASTIDILVYRYQTRKTCWLVLAAGAHDFIIMFIF